jgi:uncharacterized protein YraI
MIKLEVTDNSVSSVSDDNTTYNFSIEDRTITLAGSDNTVQTVEIPEESTAILSQSWNTENRDYGLTVTDNDWYITENTKKMAIQLTKYLMQLYNIDKNHIIMHHHVTGKICPQPWCKNEQALNEWNNFLAAVSGSQSQTSVSVVPSIPAQDTISGGKQVRYTVRITAKTLNVRSGPGTIYSINRTVSKGSIYTIIEEQGNWGRLLSGAGWICLDYTEKTEVVQQQSSNKLPYLVRITADSLNVRKGPGTNYDIVRTVSRPSIYTIVEEQGKWGKLKSGIGYIHLDYTEKV